MTHSNRYVLSVPAMLILFFAAPMPTTAAEQVTLPVRACMGIAKGIARDGKELVPVDIEGYYPAALLAFDTRILDAVGPLTVRQATLRLGIQYVRRIKRDAAVAPRLSVHKLIRSIDNYADGAKVSLTPGTDYKAEPWMTYALPDDVNSGDAIELPLPAATRGSDILATLQRGVVVLLERQGTTAIIQINFHGHTARGRNTTLRPRIDIEIESDNPKLDLRPAVGPQTGKYVTRKGSDFYYDSKPIRFLGINIHAGEWKTYESIDNYVNRLANMNINAVRLWATGNPRPFYTPESAAKGRMVESTKGDGSATDRYDYLVYKIQEAGLFIHNTALGSAGGRLEYWPGLDEVRHKKKEKGHDGAYYNVFPIMGYLHEGTLEADLTHIRLYLNRVNPYTGQRYAEMPVFATWELANENHTVAYLLEGRFEKWPPVYQQILQKRWNQWLTEKYTDRAGLLKAWGQLNDDEDPAGNTVQPAPTYKQVKDYPEPRGRDFVRFVQHLFISATQQREAMARSCAPTGVGINAAPIAANTHADLNMHAQYASSVGDFASVAVYQTPYTTQTDKPHYPWRPISTERPYFYNLNFQTIAGKPFTVYEHSFFRPYPYRAEWTPALMLLGAGLGWDSFYTYVFGQPWAICDGQTSDLSFLSKRLAIPADTTHRGYTSGFHHGNDEVLMASTALSAQAFINGIAPNREKTHVTFGRDAIDNLRYRHYSPGGPAAPVPDREMSGGETEWYNMPNLYRKFMHTSVRKQLTLAFDPQQDAPIAIKGELMDMTELNDEDRATLNASPDITWDPKNERIILDTPHSKIIVGFIRNGYTFKDGIKLGPINRDFAFFGIASRDGKPIAQSRDLILTLVSTSANTGYKFDPKKIKGSTLGHINGVVDRGTAPVIVDRVAGRIDLQGVKGKLECYNFATYRYRQTTVDGHVQFTGDEPLFVARIRR